MEKGEISFFSAYSEPNLLFLKLDKDAASNWDLLEQSMIG